MSSSTGYSMLSNFLTFCICEGILINVKMGVGIVSYVKALTTSIVKSKSLFALLLDEVTGFVFKGKGVLLHTFLCGWAELEGEISCASHLLYAFLLSKLAKMNHLLN